MKAFYCSEETFYAVLGFLNHFSLGESSLGKSPDLSKEIWKWEFCDNFFPKM